MTGGGARRSLQACLEYWCPPGRSVWVDLRGAANASLYAPNGAALFWMIRYYWLTPAARGELGNGVAVHRLRAGQFPAI